MRSKMVLILALAMGMITTVLFYQYMAKFDKKETTSAPTIEIVVAKERIEKNEKITAEKLDVIQIPEESALPQTLSSISQAEGKLADAMIEKGEPILGHRLVSQKEETVYVSRKVREGYRAVSVSFNLPQSVTNLVEPEDEVDVIFSKEDKKAVDVPDFRASILLEKARVLAVGRKFTFPENTKEPYVEYTAVTLELMPADAVKLVKASQDGSLHLMLRTRPIMKADANPSEGNES
ncbi:Flp pilus assembly protein CpaB [Neobacillus piezotolerans]|uniref:Flp pilus assembly protein CpaB n=1 Tax=Neobacillus piezotolerans TaxID=2259171 RepID=A0A3D8GMN9_9BACI|nr:Flp pilus assembly protein CpaB [Neobacillus piezotolerans]RDU35532.1 Flp pilus assembly protein CpaB [Neobacillus piezotolerans]